MTRQGRSRGLASTKSSATRSSAARGDDLLFGDVICRDTEADPHNCVFRDASIPETADPSGTPSAAAAAAATTGDADRLSGGSGDDELHGGWGVDWLEGGAGADVLLGGIEMRIRDFPFPERLYGGDGADRLYSNARNRRLADPSIVMPAEPGALDAVLDGGDGADELVGAYDTRDRMLGGDGADEIDARYGSATVQDPSRATCILHTSSGSGCWDRLSGGLGDDVLWGSPAADLLRGGADDDELDGGAGNDWLAGGAGDDVVDGGLGADRLSGGAGDDVLVGAESSGTGEADTFISCGAGTDRVYRQANDGQAPGDCERVITVVP